MYLGFRKPSNNHQKLYEEGDNQKIIQGLKREKRFNSALKMFMRNQRRLPNSSTTKSSALTSGQEMVNISESKRLSKQCSWKVTTDLKILKNANDTFLIWLKPFISDPSWPILANISYYKYFFWKTTHLIYLVI